MGIMLPNMKISAATISQPHSQSISSHSYIALRNQVQKLFQGGQDKINQAKAETYWKVGRAINAAVDRAHTPYLPKGRHVVIGLAEDLEIEKTLLYRCLEFAEKFPHFAISQNVQWSHYVELIPVSNHKMRSGLVRKISEEDWTVEQLRTVIQRIKKDKGNRRTAASGSPLTALLNPRIGKLDTYRLVGNSEFGFENQGELFLDQGFRLYSPIQRVEVRRKKFENADLTSNFQTLTSKPSIVELQNNKIIASGRTDKDRYFYRARVEKGIDGDTFWTFIELGLGERTEQKLRLRGINAAEVGAYGAKKATQFLKTLLPGGSEILLKTSPSPNHDRYVADVYVEWRDVEGRIGKKREKEGLSLKSLDPSSLLLFPLLPSSSSKYIFLNNLLLALKLVRKE